MNNEELLVLIGGPGAELADLSNDYVRRSYTSIKEKLFSLGCSKEEVQKHILSYPDRIFLGKKKFNNKIDCLVEEKISMSQIIENLRIFNSSINTFKS